MIADVLILVGPANAAYGINSYIADTANSIGLTAETHVIGDPLADWMTGDYTTWFTNNFDQVWILADERVLSTYSPFSDFITSAQMMARYGKSVLIAGEWSLYSEENNNLNYDVSEFVAEMTDSYPAYFYGADSTEGYYQEFEANPNAIGNLTKCVKTVAFNESGSFDLNPPGSPPVIPYGWNDENILVRNAVNQPMIAAWETVGNPLAYPYGGRLIVTLDQDIFDPVAQQSWPRDINKRLTQNFLNWLSFRNIPPCTAFPLRLNQRDDNLGLSPTARVLYTSQSRQNNNSARIDGGLYL